MSLLLITTLCLLVVDDPPVTVTNPTEAAALKADTRHVIVEMDDHETLATVLRRVPKLRRLDLSHPGNKMRLESFKLLARVAVIGASASSGWGVLLRYMNDKNRLSTQTISMSDIIEEVILVDDAQVTGEGNGMFFMSPLRAGKYQIETTKKAQPTLVFALDYLFWYGYGNRDVKGEPIPMGDLGKPVRLALLEEGLKNLDTFSCPLVVGDFPDVSDAVGYMLSASKMPSPATLKALNARVQQWASKRPNVIVVEMSKLVKDMRSDQVFKMGRQEWPRGSKSQFMQQDNLHPTLDGLIVLIQEASDQLAAHHDDIEIVEFDFNVKAVRDRLYEARRPEGMTPKPYTGRK
jgi:hypothetical protein